MMLADPGLLENLAESFRKQRLDDSSKSECFGHLRSTLDFQQTVRPCRLSSSKTMVYQCEREDPKACFTAAEQTVPNNQKHKTKKLSMSTRIAKPLQVTKPRDSFKEEYFKSKQINSSLSMDLSRKSESSSLEILSSSEEELRELCSTQSKPFCISREVPQANPAERVKGKICTIEKYSGFVDTIDDKDISRKRFKTARGRFKKKIKCSRPSLNMEKMMATRLSVNKDLTNEDFFPIEMV